MLKKKLGINAIERNYFHGCSEDYFKIPSTLIIPEGCTWIGYAAFEFCTNLKEVVIPESVEEIGNWAFGGCTITLKKPESVFKEIGENAFDYAKDVKEEVRN